MKVSNLGQPSPSPFLEEGELNYLSGEHPAPNVVKLSIHIMVLDHAFVLNRVVNNPATR
jgi:hypothetical protein